MSEYDKVGSSPPSQDFELFASLKAGSKQAFKDIYNKYWGVMFIHAFKMLKDEEEAKDALQELFINLWAQRNSLYIQTSLKAYLYTALRNRILNIFDRRAVSNKYLQSLAVYFEEHHLIVEEQYRQKELSEIIEKEITYLPDKMRLIFELSRKSNLTYKEIGEQLNISDKTVKKQINNAIKRLKLKVIPYLLVSLYLMLS